jgi:hypothetical protein
MKKYSIGALLLMLCIFSSSIFAQDGMMLETDPIHKNERGFTISLATSGIGLGGVYRFALPLYSHIGFSLEFFIMRDDNEFELYDPYFNRFVKVNDINRLFLIPINVELKKRLFVNSIENNFRPHLLLQAGTVYGMNFPNEAFVDGNTIKPDNEYQFAPSFLAGLGVDFTTRESYFATLRAQYRYTYFPETIAGKNDHSAFEIKFEIGGLW